MILSNGTVELTRSEAVGRAVDCSKDWGYGYGLGKGGRNPAGDKPYSKSNHVDCSGAVCYFLGIDRLQNNLGGKEEFWWSTDSIHDDVVNPASYAKGPNWFGPCLTVKPGDLLVYPDYKVNGQLRQGHVAVVSRLLPGFQRGHVGPKVFDHRTGKWSYPEAWFTHTRIIHATPSHRTTYGNVIAETDARAFRARKLADGKTIGGTFVRFLKFKPDALSAVTSLPTPTAPAPAVAKAELPVDPMILRLANMFPRQPRVTARKVIWPERERLAALAN